jgi:hypothetical protein
MKLTLYELGNFLLAGMATRTMHMWSWEEDIEITDDWNVVLITTRENGILNIYCEAPED